MRNEPPRFTPVQDRRCNTVSIQFNVECVLQGVCRLKLDKTGITLIDEIIIAKSLPPSGSLHGISSLKCLHNYRLIFF